MSPIWMLLGVGAGAVALVATRKRAATRPSSRGPKDLDSGSPGVELDGCVDGIYSDADGDKILAVVNEWIEDNAQPWTTPQDIVLQAHEAAGLVFARLCPSLEFPEHRHLVTNFANTYGPPWENLYNLATQWTYDKILANG